MHQFVHWHLRSSLERLTLPERALVVAPVVAASALSIDKVALVEVGENENGQQASRGP